MARNAVGLALLVAFALAGCSGQKEAKAAEAKAAALRARADSLRKARHAADSLAQIRFAACVDSVRVELIKAPVVQPAKSRSRPRKAPPPPPSEELIAAQAQSACGPDARAPMTTAASEATAPKPRAADSSISKATVAATSVAPVKPAADSGVAPVAATVSPALDSAAVADSIEKARETEMSRETFAYSGSTRDPFNSLLNMAKSGPEVADLQLVGIYQNMRSSAGNVAVFREREGGKRHKLRAGDQIGRSRVVQIRERDVVFMIEDFGFERQETLSLRKQEDVTP